MKTFYLTDAGKVREHNEDNLIILKNSNDEYLLAVADGMGGHKAGEVASSIAIKYIEDNFKDSFGTKQDAINWLRESATKIISLVDDLYSLFSSKQTEDESPKEEKKKLTLEEVRTLLAAKSRDGYTAEVKALLKSFGANKLSEVKEEDYEDLYLQAEVIGDGESN